MFKRVPTADVAEAQTLLSDGALLLDVRRDDEWRAGHAQDAIHIPLGQLQERVSEVPTDRRIVAVCRSGSRSAQATRYLRQLGHDAINLDGGMQAWQRAGADVVDDDGGAGRVA
ncbi:MAG: rhodanese-like domain-containing protein [Actinobacteria bacterium]|nr:rhodanese-like domain-containing protein [Actinomycetota bacterium]